MEEPKSKSQKKRDAEDLQDLGKHLLNLSADDLATIPLSERLLIAIQDAKSIKSHGATRRQLQLIGKLMRSDDHVAIAEAYANLQADDKAQTAQFHATEYWRDKLIQGDNVALSEFIDTFQPDDIQHLRQMIQKARSTKNLLQQKTAIRALFRYIKTYL